MTSKALLRAFVAHLALLAGDSSYLAPAQIRGRMALNARLVLHVEAALDRTAAARKAA